MLFVVFVSAVLVLSAPAVQGQVYGWGRCPNVPVAQNFQLDRWLGTWIEIARTPSSVEGNLDCVTDTSSRHEDGRIVVSGGSPNGDGDGSETNLYGVVNPEEPAKFSVPYFSLLPELPFWILEVDHDPQTGYYVGFTCYDIWVGNMQLVWIMSKERRMDEARLNGILRRLEGYGMDTSNLEYPKQDGTCPALPEDETCSGIDI